MADAMNCPNCATEMTPDGDHHDHACHECGLCAPVEVLERLEHDLARAAEPIAILDEAERLLRAAGVYTVTLRVRHAVTLRSHAIRLVLSEGRTLANAYANLVHEPPGEAPAPEMTYERARELEQDETATLRALREHRKG